MSVNQIECSVLKTAMLFTLLILDVNLVTRSKSIFGEWLYSQGWRFKVFIRLWILQKTKVSDESVGRDWDDVMTSNARNKTTSIFVYLYMGLHQKRVQIVLKIVFSCKIIALDLELPTQVQIFSFWTRASSFLLSDFNVLPKLVCSPFEWLLKIGNFHY